MTYHNILSNPTLQTINDNLHVEKLHVLDFPPQEIWHPVQWHTLVIPTVHGQIRKRTEDLHIIPTVWPQTIDGKAVLTIEANTKHFVVRLTKSSIQLKRHQRYVVKVVFNPAVVPLGDVSPVDLSWRLTVDKRSNEFTDGFQSVADIGEWGTKRSALMVFHSYEAQVVDLWVEFWSKWGNLDKQIFIHSIEILEVEQDYGEGGSVHSIGDPLTPPPVDPDDDVIPDDPLPDPPSQTLPAWAVVLLGIVGAIIVGVVVYSLVAPRLVASASEESLMEIINIQEAGTILVAAIGAILAGGLAAPVTEPVVGLIKYILKRVGWETKLSGDAISLAVAAIVTIIIWLSRRFGVVLQIETVFDALVQLIPAITLMLGAFFGQKFVYQIALKGNVPLFGYKRS